MTESNRPITSQAEAAIRAADPRLRRRFGRRHEKPCKNPNMLSCAQWECQVRDCCRLADEPGNGKL